MTSGSLEGCEIVAGGRSEAQTTVQSPVSACTLKECQILYRRLTLVLLHPSRVLTNYLCASGGLRYASTTGYYLAALQADSS